MEPHVGALAARARWLARFAAIGGILAGVLALVGWQWQIPELLAPGPSRSQISPDAALASIGLGLALLLASRETRWARSWARVAAGLVGLLSLLSLLRDVSGVGPLLYQAGPLTPMVPTTSVAFLLLALSVFTLDRPARRLMTLSEVLALTAGLIAAFALIGYLYSAERLIGLLSDAMVALPTAVILLLLAIGMHGLAPQRGWVATLLDQRSGGVLLRHLLLSVVLLPPLIGYLALSGQRQGLFGNAFGYAIVACVDAIVIAWLLTVTCARLNCSEAGRLSEQSLRQKLEQLGAATVAISGAIIHSRQIGMSHTMELRADVDTQTIMQAIIDQACQVTSAGVGAIGIGTDPAEPFYLWAFSGMDADMSGRIGLPLRPVGTLGEVARDGQTIRMRDVTTHEAFTGFPLGHPPVTSFLAVPIRFDGRSVGILYLGNKQGAEEFSLEDQRAIEMIVPHAAVALHQAQMQAVITTQQAHIETVLAAAPNGILFVDAGTERMAVNAMATQLLGMPLDTSQGRSQYLSLMRHPDGQPALKDELPSTRALMGQMVLDEEWLIEQRGGRRVPIAISAAPVRQEDGSIAGAVVILQDITRRKSLERQRTEYISLISHDLRGPLTVISLQAAALANSTDPLVAPRAAGIQANVRRLTTMIGDMVETSRLETGQTPIEKSAVDVATALHRLVGTGLGEGDRQHVTLDVAAGLPPVCLDPARFERVILNLIGNARKYAGKDWQATISARVIADDLYVSVADRGPGIAATDLPHLFDKHFRGQQSGKAEGLGLGLYICRLIVEGHGGRIWAENRPEGGAVIRMRFPAASTSARTAA